MSKMLLEGVNEDADEVFELEEVDEADELDTDETHELDDNELMEAGTLSGWLLQLIKLGCCKHDWMNFVSNGSVLLSLAESFIFSKNKNLFLLFN